MVMQPSGVCVRVQLAFFACEHAKFYYHTTVFIYSMGSIVLCVWLFGSEKFGKMCKRNRGSVQIQYRNKDKLRVVTKQKDEQARWLFDIKIWKPELFSRNVTSKTRIIQHFYNAVFCSTTYQGSVTWRMSLLASLLLLVCRFFSWECRNIFLTKPTLFCHIRFVLSSALPCLI